MRRPSVYLLLCAVLCGLALQSRADDARVTSSQIALAATDLACIDYQVVGGCLWMTCTAVVCDFDFSIRAEHRIPEVVVTAYPYLGNSSWVEGNRLVSPTAFAHEGGASDEGGAPNREQALKFKNADVIGSPGVTGAWIAAMTLSSELAPFCTPLTLPLTPYFVSSYDPAWRDPTIETPLTLRYALARVGKGASTFAGLYPRHGFVNQGHDYKSALTAAIRAMDIVRQSAQPHVYLSLGSFGSSGQGQWPPRGEAGVYQQLTPHQLPCTELPDIDDTWHVSDPYSARLNQATGNAWQVWRRYGCCEPAGAVLLFSF